MPDRFEACLPHTLKYEGGWSDHPLDKGGATMKGITLAVFREWTGKQSTKDELRAISDATVAALYRKNYWYPSHCDKLPAGVDMMIFDLAVNSGPARARRYLQGAVDAIEDGVIGPATLAAVAKADPKATIRRIGERRERFFRSLDTFPTFGKGWLRRLAEVTAKALEMAK